MRIARAIRIRYVLLPNFVFFFVFHSEAQNTGTVNQHTFTAGAGTQMINDKFISLSSEKILSTELSYSFTSNNINREKNVTVSWGGGSGETSKGQLKANEFSFQYTDVFSVLKNKSHRLNNYLGYSLATNPQYIKWGDQNSWATVNTLALYNSTVYSWDKNNLSLGIAVPVAGLASRPVDNLTYKGDINGMLYDSYSNLAFTSLHNLKAITISLRYQKGFSERLQFQAGAFFSYKELATGSDFLQRSFRFHTGLSYRLR